MSPLSNGMRRSWHAFKDALRKTASPTARMLGALGLFTALSIASRAQIIADPPNPIGTPFAGFHVTTHRYNNQRTGVNASETFLTPQIVRNGFITPTGAQQVFGKMFSRPLDGDVYAQPLLVSNVPTTDPFTQVFALRNVLYVCTANNTIYAFDADNATGNFARPYWQRNFNYPLLEILPVPSEDIFPFYFDIAPTIGIIGTPVIDVAAQTMYVVVRTKEFGSYRQRLYAIDIITGQDRPNSPVEITGSVEGNASDAFPDPADPTANRVYFDPLMQNQQAALLLANNLLYIAWGSHADLPDYHGWIMAYNPTTLQQVAVFNTTRDAQFNFTRPVGGGIVMGSSGIASDEAGNLYVASGSGVFDADIGGRNYGSSILKLRPDLTLYDYFTPFNHPFLTENRLDLGSGGVVVLPQSVGSAEHPNLLIAGGLEGRLYLLDRTDKATSDEIRMGEFFIGADQVVESYRNAVGPIYGAPAFFNGRLYYNSAGDVLKQFQIANGSLNPITEHRSNIRLDFPGASPIISANGTQNGIVWTVGAFYPPGPVPPSAVLYAHDASNVSQALFNGISLGETNLAGSYIRHTVPVVANGKVYVAAGRQIATFGMTSAKPGRASGFIIEGPMFTPPFPVCLISEKTNYSFHISSVGPNGQPLRITDSVQLVLREPSGALRQLATLPFNNESTIIHTRLFPVPGIYELMITDRKGTSGSTTIFVAPYATEGQDRYEVRMKSAGRVGELVPLTVTAVSANGTPISVFNVDTTNNVFVPRFFSVFSTIPNGGYDQNHPDPLGASPQLFFQSRVTLLVRLRRPGKQVFVVTDGGRTGTAVIDVHP